jgi:hypothetical protein
LTEEQYKLLCATCDSVLLEGNAQFERIAIPWLHVIREHPVFLQQYKDLFSSQARLNNLNNLVRHFLKKNFSILKQIWRIFRLPRKHWVGGIEKSKSYDVIFISHLLTPSQLSSDRDFYFGDVPILMQQQGFSVLLVLINHTSESNSALLSNGNFYNIQRLIIPDTLSLKSELQIWIATIKQARLLRKKAKSESDEFKKSVLYKASWGADSSATKTSMRIAMAIEEIMSLTKPRVLVALYEGHSWERLAFYMARKANSTTKCIGYQHAALFQLQHASRRSLGEKYDPDVILTAGGAGLNQWKQSRGFSNLRFDVLGSNRSLKKLKRQPQDTCIVLPEGYLSECEILFSFSLQCALKHPQVTFVWRLHPILSFDDLARVGIEIEELPINVIISTKTLEEDLVNCRWALFRGSTSIVTAASNGIIPLYLEREGELSVNPLFEIASSHPSISSVDQFLPALDAPNWNQKSINYCLEFYTPFDFSKLAQQVKEPLKNSHDYRT